MKKEIIFCDRCGAEGARPIDIIVDRRLDAAGSMDDIWESIDICPECEHKAFMNQLKNMSYEEREKVVKWARKKVGA